MAKYKIYPDNSFPSGVPAASVSSLTLYRPLEECLARLTRGDAVVETGGRVSTNETTPLRLLLLILDQLRMVTMITIMMMTTAVMMMQRW